MAIENKIYISIQYQNLLHCNFVHAGIIQLAIVFGKIVLAYAHYLKYKK